MATNSKMCVTVQFLFCFILNLRTISKYKPPEDLYSEGRFIGGFLRYEFGGLMFGGTYTFTWGLIFGILR